MLCTLYCRSVDSTTLNSSPTVALAERAVIVHFQLPNSGCHSHILILVAHTNSHVTVKGVTVATRTGTRTVSGASSV